MSLLSTLCSFFLAFFLELLLVGKHEWKAEVLWLLVEGQWKMLVDFVVVIEVASVRRTWQNK